MASFHGLDYEPVVYDDVSGSAADVHPDERFDWVQPYDPTYVSPDVSALDWFRTAPVQAALAELGHPDGTDDWTYEFARHLLGYVDAVEQITKNDDLTIQTALEAVSVWNYELAIHSGTFNDGFGGHSAVKNFWAKMPKEIPTLLLTHTIAGRTMTFDNCAWLLGVTPRDLEATLWPKVDRNALYFAAECTELYPSDSLEKVAKQHGTSRTTLANYLLLRRGVHYGLSQDNFELALSWMEFGGSWQDAYNRLVADEMVHPSYKAMSFKRRVNLHRRRIAA